MLSALFITLREGFEAALLIGLVLAVAAKFAAPSARRWIWLGVLAGVRGQRRGRCGALRDGRGADGKRGGRLRGRRHAVRRPGARLDDALDEAAGSADEHRAPRQGGTAGGTAGLFWLGFLVVVREGLETALFLFAAVGSRGSVATLLGGLAGLAVAAALGLRGVSRQQPAQRAHALHRAQRCCCSAWAPTWCGRAWASSASSAGRRGRRDRRSDRRRGLRGRHGVADVLPPHRGAAPAAGEPGQRH